MPHPAPAKRANHTVRSPYELDHNRSEDQTERTIRARIPQLESRESEYRAKVDEELCAEALGRYYVSQNRWREVEEDSTLKASELGWKRGFWPMFFMFRDVFYIRGDVMPGIDCVNEDEYITSEGT